MTFLSSGNVGINETSPGVKLQLISADEQLTNFSSSVADQLAYSQINANSSTSGTITAAAALELVGNANGSGHGRHAWIGAEGTSNTTLLTKLKFKVRGQTASGYDWAGAAEAPTIMTLEGDGNVGIGTTSPATKLEVNGDIGIGRVSGGYTFREVVGGGERASMKSNASNELIFSIGASTQAMRINSSGNVGIGTISPDDMLEVYGSSPNIRVTNTAETDAGIVFNDAQAGTGQMAAIKFNSSDEKLKFFVNDETSQRMVIDTAGNVGIGPTISPSYLLDVRDGTTSGAIARFSAINAHVVIESSTAGNAVLHLKPNATGSKFGQFKVTAGNGYGFSWSNDAAGTGETTYMDLDTSSTGGGDLTVKGDVIAYGSPSDKKYKENIKPIESALDKAMQLQGVTFDWKDSDSILDIKEDIGFIAQDVQEVLPELVRDSGKGNLSLRYQGITPILLEAIKELKAEIDLLKSKPCNCNNCNCNI